MKDKTLLIVIMEKKSFLFISFWNIIPNKMDAFLLGHGVVHTYEICEFIIKQRS